MCVLLDSIPCLSLSWRSTLCVGRSFSQPAVMHLSASTPFVFQNYLVDSFQLLSPISPLLPQTSPLCRFWVALGPMPSLYCRHNDSPQLESKQHNLLLFSFFHYLLEFSTTSGIVECTRCPIFWCTCNLLSLSLSLSAWFFHCHSCHFSLLPPKIGGPGNKQPVLLLGPSSCCWAWIDVILITSITVAEGRLFCSHHL